MKSPLLTGSLPNSALITMASFDLISSSVGGSVETLIIESICHSPSNIVDLISSDIWLSKSSISLDKLFGLSFLKPSSRNHQMVLSLIRLKKGIILYLSLLSAPKLHLSFYGSGNIFNIFFYLFYWL